MKVLFLINYAGKGGTEKYVLVLMEKLLKQGHECVLVYHEQGPLAAEADHRGIKNYALKMTGPMDIKAAKGLAKICRDEGIKIIHTQFARENYIALHAKRYVEELQVIHTAHINLSNNFIWKTANHFTMDKNTHIIAVCQSVKDHLIANHYPKHKISVIPNGIEFKASKSEASPGEIKDISDEFRLKGNDFLFVTLTRFSAEKGIFFLLESIEKLKQLTQKPFKVLFAGDGELLNEAKAFAKEKQIEDQVLFAGYRQDSQKILEAGKVFLNSSSSEASSFAILEAMAMGLPVIATEVGGNPDLVNEKNGCGILVPYGDAHKMAKAMLIYMEDEDRRKKAGQWAYEAVRDVLNVDVMFQKTMDIYNKCI